MRLLGRKNPLHIASSCLLLGGKQHAHCDTILQVRHDEGTIDRFSLERSREEGLENDSHAAQDAHHRPQSDEELAKEALEPEPLGPLQRAGRHAPGGGLEEEKGWDGVDDERSHGRPGQAHHKAGVLHDKGEGSDGREEGRRHALAGPISDLLSGAEQLEKGRPDPPHEDGVAAPRG